MLLTVTRRRSPGGRRLADGLEPPRRAGCRLDAHARAGGGRARRPAPRPRRHRRPRVRRARARRRTTPAGVRAASRPRRPSRPPSGRRRSPARDPDAVPTAAAGRLAAALGVDAAARSRPRPARRGRAPPLVASRSSTRSGRRPAATTPPTCSTRSATTRSSTRPADARGASTSSPAGPLPTIRVGPQPYGVLPVVAARRYQPAAGRPRRGGSSRGSAGALRSLWEPLRRRSPRLGRAGQRPDVDALLLELLQRTPVPWGLRLARDGAAAAVVVDRLAQRYRTYQAPYLSTIMELLGVPRPRAARVQYLTRGQRQPSAAPCRSCVKGEERHRVPRPRSPSCPRRRRRARAS